MTNLKNEKGITLLSLAITIAVMIILAGVILSVETDNNNLIESAETYKSQVERMAIEEEIKTYLAEEPPSNYTELIAKLTRYGTIKDKDNPQSAILITSNGNYSIYVKDIWNVNF